MELVVEPLEFEHRSEYIHLEVRPTTRAPTKIIVEVVILQIASSEGRLDVTILNAYK